MLYPVTWWLLKLTVNLLLMAVILIGNFIFGCCVVHGISKVLEQAPNYE